MAETQGEPQRNGTEWKSGELSFTDQRDQTNAKVGLVD